MRRKNEKFWEKAKVFFLSFLISLFFLFSLSLGLEAQARTKFISIGTGSVTGVYYPVGGAIAKMMNEKRKQHSLRASAESTAGSVYNVNAVASGDLQFGVVQSDRQYQALNGLKEWEGKAQKNLRSVFSLHPEAVSLIAAVDTQAKKMADLKGKKVSIGARGSGERANALDILKIFGFDAEKFFKLESLRVTEAPRMLQDRRIDAFFFTAGQPNGALTEATSGRRKVSFLPIEGPAVENLIKQYPYYAVTYLDMKHYPMAANQKGSQVPTVGVKATLITSTKVSRTTVYKVTKEIFTNFDKFKVLHPALSSLELKDLLTGLSMPLHKGALKYYKEANLTQHLASHLRQ